MPETAEPKFLDDERLLERLKRATNLPSPPSVAARVIELGEDPEVSVNAVAEAISLDPAMTTKILRIANSPLYARHRKIDNLRQAIMLFGLNGTLTLALSFSLVGTLRAHNGKGMDHTLYWRRSITAATACRVIGMHLGIEGKEDLFLAGLLQDIGMLVLNKVVPDLYQDLGADQASHQRVREMERQSLGDDHAAVGAWLLQSWQLPQRIICATTGSHEPRRANCDPKYQSLVRCVALGGAVADIWCGDDNKRATQEATQLADAFFDMDRETFANLLAPVATEALETAALFDTKLDDEAFSETILEQAKETLMLRGLQSAQEAAELQQTATSLEVRARALEEETRRDGLTGLYNRAHLDRVLGEEFANAKRHHWPLAVAFIDLDYFKRINDSYGHHAGDQILKVAASLLLETMRTTDIVARYGGEEFVTLLPGTGAEGAKVAGERLVKVFADARHHLGQHLEDNPEVVVTASVGVATQEMSADFEHPEDLLRAADRALYVAKLKGRNRCVVHASGAKPEGTSSSNS